MFERVCERVYLVGGPDQSDGRDCLVYLVDVGDLVLIDCGCGAGWPRIKDNIAEAGLYASGIHTLILTHCHVDHIGAANAVREESGCRVVAHALDAGAIESGDPRKTAADWYNMKLPRTKVDLKIKGSEQKLGFRAGELEVIHTPGHTPGSMVVVLEQSDRKILFGQDIHGPFEDSFDSDIDAWRQSMLRLLALDAEILCEGHYGVFKPADAVRKFITQQLDEH